MEMLKRAIELRPEYDDAMVYLNLLFRERAAIECGDPAARSNDERLAKEWADKAMQARNLKLERATQVTQPSQNN
jgi:hypothetical protein